MPTRRTFELIVITVVLLHPVIRMARVWAHKHLQTSDSAATGVVAEVTATLA
jgi:methionine-rich copper-binding protein CopC